MSIIIVGSNHSDTAEYYKKHGIGASVLVTDITHSNLIGHTCIQDIPEHDKLEIVLKNADDVYWAESNKNEFSDVESYYEFLNWLKDYNLKYHNVKNINLIKFDLYNWTRTVAVDKNHAVFLGCSFTAGTGLSDPATHYSTIMANYFNKKLLNLGVPGGSNNLIFDRFTQLDFHPGQIIIIQFTELCRIHYCTKDKKLLPLMFSTTKINKSLHESLLEVYNNDFLFYELLIKIRAIVAIARSNKLKLIFWLNDYKNSDTYSKLYQTYFYDMHEFVPASWIENYFVDSAEDNLHPGINSNKNLASSLINYIETIYERRH